MRSSDDGNLAYLGVRRRAYRRAGSACFPHPWEHKQTPAGKRVQVRAWASRGQGAGSVVKRKDGCYVVRLHIDGVRPLIGYARSAFATLMYEAGTETKKVSAARGHSSTAITTDLYTHVTTASQRRVANAADANVRRR
jgi:integrase